MLNHDTRLAFDCSILYIHIVRQQAYRFLFVILLVVHACVAHKFEITFERSIVLQYIANKAFIDGIFHRIYIKRLFHSVLMLTEDLNCFGFRSGSERIERYIVPRGLAFQLYQHTIIHCIYVIAQIVLFQHGIHCIFCLARRQKTLVKFLCFYKRERLAHVACRFARL